jgi:hypothetical protein
MFNGFGVLRAIYKQVKIGACLNIFLAGILVVYREII